MAFQRSYSKVWWGSTSDNNSLANFYNGNGNGNGNGDFHSLDSHNKYSGNLSRIQEVEENSKLWVSHDSPGSLRSQDSGFSDHDDSPRSSSLSSGEATKSDFGSPISSRTINTPPTVIRRHHQPHQMTPTSVRQISFSAPSSPVPSNHPDSLEIDRINLANSSTPITDHQDSDLLAAAVKDRSIRRRRGVTVNRKTKRNLLNRSSGCEDLSLNDDEDTVPDYNNETVYFGNGCPRNPIETITLSTDYFEYENPVLNGHSLPVQHWLDDVRMSYDKEVMSTLQTKSIAQEAYRNLKITTNCVAKIIRQLQSRAVVLQGEFDRVEKILNHQIQCSSFGDLLFNVQNLIDSIIEFVHILDKRSSVFFTKYRTDRKKFNDNLEHIALVVKDLRISLEKEHYLDLETMLDDVQVLKRYILITIRLVFEKLIRIIVGNIENSKCDLMLRANLNMIATISNFEYSGFAALTDAFIENETERVLLLVCLDSKLGSVRALTLRALATICSTSNSIRQFCEAGGVEIIRDILQIDPCEGDNKRTEPEKREAVSLLTQITAPWHGPDHRVDGFKTTLDSIVEGITDIIVKTNCCQTLLLCAASLNNLSRLEVTSVYSIMSNETIVKLKETVERRGPGVSIFLYEQIVFMLSNMSSNKKCHCHLANRNIINFITYIFQSQFYEKFESRAESEAHRHTIKTILHIFQRLIHESVIGHEILEQNFIPIFSKVEQDLLKSPASSSDYTKQISYFNKQLNDSVLSNKSLTSSSSTNKLSTTSTRQESYV